MKKRVWQERVTRALPTRSLLEQQLLVRQGEIALDHLDALQHSLLRPSTVRSGNDDEEQRT